MEFTYTEKSMAQARKIRYKNEPKWNWLRITTLVVWIIQIAVPIWIYFAIMNLLNDSFEAWSFAICAFVTLGVLTLLTSVMKLKFTSDGIGDMYGEKLSLENGNLYKVYKSELGGGINALREACEVSEIRIPLSSIYNLRYDPKSKRIEFMCTTYFTMYDDWQKTSIVRQTTVGENVSQFFYDFYEPSLIDALRNQGIPCKEEQIEYTYMRGIQAEREMKAKKKREGL